MIEEMRKKRQEAEEDAKFQERKAKSNLAQEVGVRAETIVQEIIKLEDLISDRVNEQPDPAWRVSQKERELIDERETLEDYYAGEKTRMRNACDAHIDAVNKKRDSEIEKIEQRAREEIERLTTRLAIAMENKEAEEKLNLERKDKKISQQVEKRGGILTNQKIPVSLKKMKRQLAELVERYPRVITDWVQNYKLEDLKQYFDVPTDYKKHRIYKNKRKIPDEIQLETEKQKSESPEPKVPLKIKNETPLSSGEKGGLENIFSVKAEPTISVKPLVSNSVVRTKKTVAIAENASGSMFNGINIISSAKRPQIVLTTVVPGKKWLQYSLEERNNMSHYDAYNLEFEWKEELAEERNRKDRELQAKISKEQDEAEAEGIRAMRKAEEAEKEWAALEED